MNYTKVLTDEGPYIPPDNLPYSQKLILTLRMQGNLLLLQSSYSDYKELNMNVIIKLQANFSYQH